MLDEHVDHASGPHLDVAHAPEVVDQQLAVRFAMGRAHEALEDWERARQAFGAVAAIDPSFCEVEERLQALDESEKPAPEDLAPADVDTGEFETFDDVMSDVEEEPVVEDGGVEEDYEDFADFTGDTEEREAPDAIAEAEVTQPVELEPETESVAEAELIAEPEPDPGDTDVAVAPPADPPKTDKKRKRKKISFV